MDKKELKVNCANCPTAVCGTKEFMKGPENCPTKIKADVIASVRPRYKDPKFAEFSRVASVIEGVGHMKTPWMPDVNSPRTTRLEEIMMFAKTMGYKKLGVAYCRGFRKEAGILIPILENHDFEIVSVCCKHGSIPKEEIGLTEDEKVNPGNFEPMCNPISQAAILNSEQTEFNIMMGLCVGHDALFLKHCDALTTVFVVKDRLLGHNPVAALYTSHQYYRRLRGKELPPVK